MKVCVVEALSRHCQGVVKALSRRCRGVVGLQIKQPRGNASLPITSYPCPRCPPRSSRPRRRRGCRTRFRFRSDRTCTRPRRFRRWRRRASPSSRSVLLRLRRHPEPRRKAWLRRLRRRWTLVAGRRSRRAGNRVYLRTPVPPEQTTRRRSASRRRRPASPPTSAPSGYRRCTGRRCLRCRWYPLRPSSSTSRVRGSRTSWAGRRPARLGSVAATPLLRACDSVASTAVYGQPVARATGVRRDPFSVGREVRPAVGVSSRRLGYGVNDLTDSYRGRGIPHELRLREGELLLGVQLGSVYKNLNIQGNIIIFAYYLFKLRFVYM